jgi:RNA polymerase sigma-70 factor, ECF subfamily
VGRRRRSVESHLRVASSATTLQPTCERVEDALSAVADGEATDLSHDEIERHLASCGSCRRYKDAVASSPIVPGIVPVRTTSSPSSEIVGAIAEDDRRAASTGVRYLLFATAIAIIVLAIPDLLASEASAVAAHADRHLGSFAAAYGVLLLLTAIRPARARTALPVAVVLAAAIGITAVTDLLRGKIPLVGEAVHFPEMLSVMLVWRLTRRTDGR